MRLYGIGDPRLNRTRLQTIVVVVTAAVPATVADVGNEPVS